MIIEHQKFERLLELENSFIQQIKDKEIHLLGDLQVSEEQIDELASLIQLVLDSNNHQAIRMKYPLSTSIFLVWCSVYDYKDGVLWEPIFTRLKIVYKPKVAEFLGEVFLTTLRKYDLQKLSNNDKNKKYMTPILMHGYIGDHYTSRLLNYLNAVYSSYLKYDVSEKSIAGLWSDIFNLESEQVSLKSELESLDEKEKKLREKIYQLGIPANLRNFERLMLDENESKILSIEGKIKNFSVEMDCLEEQINLCLQIEEELIKCQFSLEEIKKIGPLSCIADFQPQLQELYQEMAEMQYSKLQNLNLLKNKISSEMLHNKNQYDSELGKIKTIKTNILTLGKGREEDGWSILADYQEMKKEIEQIQTQIEHKKSLYIFEEQLENTSLKQILTASLTHLAVENPQIFQSFISGTLRLIDSKFKGLPLDETHRMYKPLCQWIPWAEKGIKEPTDKDLPHYEKSKDNRPNPRRVFNNSRLLRPIFHDPLLNYNPAERRLFLTIPEQQILKPKEYLEKPEFILAFADALEKLSINFYMENQSMIFQERSIAITRPDIRQLLFRWFNIAENWPINLEPVMVFDEKMKLMQGRQIPNGFYYILARSSWHTDSTKLIDSYDIDLVGYTGYEIYLQESEISFNPDNQNNYEKITISGSEFSGFKLEGVDILPGVFMEELPFSYTSPSLKLVLGHQKLDTHNLFFTLRYQGDVFLSSTVDDTLELYGNPISMYITELNLDKILHQRDLNQVEKIEIAIADNFGKVVFEKSFCRIRGLRFTFGAEEIIVKIPNGARLKNEMAKQEDAKYHIPVTEHPWIEIEIYFERIGWKKFKIETPLFQLYLTNSDGRDLELPLNMLRSEIEKLKQYFAQWRTDSSIPEKIILFDEEEKLVSTYHLRNGQAWAQLNSFYDILQDVTESKKLYFRWEGNSRLSEDKCVAEIFDKVKVVSCDVFQTEKDEENLFEVSLKLNFQYQGKLMVRIFESGHREKILVDEQITNGMVYLHVNKGDTKSSFLTFEIYYQEHQESIFGDEVYEVICWQKDEKRILHKEAIREVIENGLILTAFRYEQEQYQFKYPYYIEQITLESRHFEEEELLKGVIISGEKAIEVFFYLDTETQKLPFLIDVDYDGAQYHPITGELFWECRNDADILAPLDDLEFRIREVGSL